jgi:hypothetical protein
MNVFSYNAFRAFKLASSITSSNNQKNEDDKQMEQLPLFSPARQYIDCSVACNQTTNTSTMLTESNASEGLV